MILSTKKLTKRQMQAVQTKNNLYRVLLELMKDKRFESITIEEISKNAGVSIGTFYHYFSSKEDIYQELFDQIEESLHQDLQGMENEGETAAVLVVFFVRIAEYTTELKLHTHYLSHLSNRAFSRAASPVKQQLEGIIRDAQKKNEISTAMDAEQMTNYLLVMVRGIILDWCIQEGRYSLSEVMRVYMEQMIRSIQVG